MTTVAETSDKLTDGAKRFLLLEGGRFHPLSFLYVVCRIQSIPDLSNESYASNIRNKVGVPGLLQRHPPLQLSKPVTSIRTTFRPWDLVYCRRNELRNTGLRGPWRISSESGEDLR